MKAWRRKGGVGVSTSSGCPELSFTAMWTNVGSEIEIDYSTVPPMSGDCLVHIEVQSANGDWSVLLVDTTDANAVDTMIVDAGDGIFDVRLRIECFGTLFCPWVVVEDVTVG